MSYEIGTHFNFGNYIEPQKRHWLYEVGSKVVFVKQESETQSIALSLA